MVVGIQARGADRLGRISKALRDAGAKELKRELIRGINKSTKPLRVAVKIHAAGSLPQSGGLAQRVARTRLTTRTRTGRDPSVRIVAGKNAIKGPLQLDRGRLRHPVYGHGPSVLQDVTPGWFSKPLREGALIVRPELIKAMDDVARKIARTR